MVDRKNIYVIYASENQEMVFRLLMDLRPLEDGYDIEFWEDDPIEKGAVWKPNDPSRLDRADVFLFMLSKAFMYSEFVKQLEFKKIIDNYKANKARVIPIILDKCPWDINFESDEYIFNFNELNVLPKGSKPLKDWSSLDDALADVSMGVERQIASIAKPKAIKEVPQDLEKNSAEIDGKDQLAMDFEEEPEAQLQEDEEQLIREVEAVIETEEKKAKEEAETKRKEEEELLRLEAETKRLAAEEAKRLEAERERKLAEERRQLAEAEEAERQVEITEASNITQEEFDMKDSSTKKSDKRKYILLGLVMVAGVIAAIALFLKPGNGGKTEGPSVSNVDTTAIENTIPAEPVEVSVTKKKETVTQLKVGDYHEKGIVFEVDNSGQKGKMAYMDDFGPMSWKEAMKIDDQLGEGWRLPTMDELKTMYKTIGQGAENNGEFADGLYWSSTPYDANQARLLRFRDGNTSYHYNSLGTHRKFLVRAIKDFGRE